MQTPPGSLTKTQVPKCTWGTEELELRPEYQMISYELRALAKMVQGESKENEMGNNAGNTNKSPLFIRGRFYEEYSARRNERLKRKKGNLTGDEKKTVYDLGVRVEFAKRKETKKFEGLRKLVPSTPLTERRENSTYSLRSSSIKENKKKPPLLLAVSYEKSVRGT